MRPCEFMSRAAAACMAGPPPIVPETRGLHLLTRCTAPVFMQRLFVRKNNFPTCGISRVICRTRIRKGEPVQEQRAGSSPCERAAITHT